MFNNHQSILSARRRAMPCLALALMLGTLTPLQAGQIAPGMYLDSISDNIALEIKAGYLNTLNGNNMVLYGGLFNNGSMNVIEFKELAATSTGVTVIADYGNVDSGQIFALGDWCMASDYAVMPFIKNFNIQALRFSLDDGSIGTIAVAPLSAAQYTSTDCVQLDDGRMVIAANNFDAKGIDYYVSPDFGLNWGLTLEYRLDGNTITDAFAGGFRDTHVNVDGSNIGSVYQRGDGSMETALLDLDLGALDMREIGAGSPFLGNGFLKELDGAVINNVCFGAANLGDNTFAGIAVSTDTGNILSRSLFDNSSGPNPVLNFAGVDITATPDPLVTLYNIYYLSNRLVAVQYDTDKQQFINPRSFPDFPFTSHGGPAEAFTGTGTGRYHAFGVLSNFGTGGLSGTAVVTLDPATAVSIPEQPLVAGLPSVAVPALDQPALLLLLTLLASIGAVMLVRRGG